MTTGPRHLESLEIVGGHPAIDFVNTVHSWHSDPPPDHLHHFDDFVDWNRIAGLLGPGSAEAFKAAPGSAKARAYREAIELRADLHRILAAIADGSPLPGGSLEHLNDLVRRTMKWRRLAADAATGGKTLRCVWDFDEAPALAALGPVAWAAVDLLENAPLDRLKECPNERCGWLFLDASKNRSRTWCSMRVCGNSAKVRRYRERTSAS